MNVIDLSPETLSMMRDMASSVYDTVRKTIGDGVMDAFLAALKTAAK